MNELSQLQAIVNANVSGGDADRRGTTAPLMMEPARELTPADITLHTESLGGLGVKNRTLARLRHSHHLAARAIAEGNTNVQVSALTGYDEVRIAILLESPAFQNLIAYYGSQESAKDLDFKRRLSAFGMDCLEELQHRLDENPDKISWGQLQDAAEFALNASGETATAGGGKGAPINPPNFQIVFVSPEGKPASPGDGSGPLLDGTSERVA